MDLQGKVALITGAKYGIGKAIAEEYYNRGAIVVATDIDFNDIEVKKKERKNFIFEEMDVTDISQIKNVIQYVEKAYGKLDILVANAGINIRNGIFETKLGDLERVFEVNVKGVFSCCKEACKVMKKQKEGSVIILSSVVSNYVAQPNIIAYGSSKGANYTMTKHLASELAQYNIRVNSISPGSIISEMTKERLEHDDKLKANIEKIPLKRMGQSSDITGAAVLLASDQSSFMTGSDIVIDGGESIT